MPLRIDYEFKDAPAAQEALASIAQHARLVQSERDRVRRIFLDTVGGLVLRNGGCLSLRAGPACELALRTEDGDVLRATLEEPPAFATSLPPGPIRELLSRWIGVRRLLPVVGVRQEVRRFSLLDDVDKTVVRVALIEAVAGDPGREALDTPPQLELEAVRGYDDWVRALSGRLERKRDLRPRSEPNELEHLLRTTGRKLDHPAPRPRLEWRRKEPAGRAMRTLTTALYRVMTANESGLLQNIDSEFLHHHRVALRRMRALFRHMRAAFPECAVQSLEPGLRWLGALTGPARDLDVFLLALPRKSEALAAETRAALAPLEESLQRRRSEEYERVADGLASARYAELRGGLQTYLNGISEEEGLEARTPIGKLARRRTRVLVRKLLKRGRAITPKTPVVVLHELRVLAKNLRYTTDAFDSLWDEEELARFLRPLRRLQNCLGELHDCCVQRARLEQFGRAPDLAAHSEEERLRTFEAVRHLDEALAARANAQRKRFARRFAAFDDPENIERIERLFGPLRKGRTKKQGRGEKRKSGKKAQT